jgi:hypothetical protein
MMSIVDIIVHRCYMTLTIALSLCRGGSPKGPAGKCNTTNRKTIYMLIRI